MTFRFRSVVLSAVVLFAGADLVHAQIYRWEDSSGGVHYSNRVERVPPTATVVSPPPLGSSRTFRRVRPGASQVTIPPPVRRRPSEREQRGARLRNPGRAMAHAVEHRLGGRRHRDDFTLLVDGRPVMARRDTVMQVKGVDDADAWNVLAMAAVADPGAGTATDVPALDVYRVASANGGNGGACSDFRRAFATVGIAASRDHQVAGSFREIAEHFVAAAGDGYRIRDVGAMEAHLPPWLVDGHVAQLEALSADAERYVAALTIALEEIDLAARETDCW